MISEQVVEAIKNLKSNSAYTGDWIGAQRQVERILRTTCPCPACNGDGEERNPAVRFDASSLLTYYRPCSACDGVGIAIEDDYQAVRDFIFATSPELWESDEDKARARDYWQIDDPDPDPAQIAVPAEEIEP